MKDLEATRQTASMKPEAVLEGFQGSLTMGVYIWGVPKIGVQIDLFLKVHPSKTRSFSDQKNLIWVRGIYIAEDPCMQYLPIFTQKSWVE